jgi:hypothetical protein
VINEIMQNPSAVGDSVGEWFELYNPTTDDVDIEGWTIADNDYDSQVIANGGPLIVPAGAYLVLGVNADTGTNGGAPVDYAYDGSVLISSDPWAELEAIVPVHINADYPSWYEYEYGLARSSSDHDPVWARFRMGA